MFCNDSNWAYFILYDFFFLNDSFHRGGTILLLKLCNVNYVEIEMIKGWVWKGYVFDAGCKVHEQAYVKVACVQIMLPDVTIKS